MLAAERDREAIDLGLPGCEVQEWLEILHLHDVGRDLPRGKAVREDASREQNVERDVPAVREISE
ncbi:hypothetical protein ACFVKB_12455 [Rhodococcus sp. NPDC127530]|uniref:hypothetical protein n=1 Tax=unclassified Rhodococcus (in: high G+C Gram-positive bacteria) TaxID=192944 RepID=UPI003636CA2A